MAPKPVQFWGPPTSTLDWCEVNYEVSPFIAEFCKHRIVSSICWILSIWRRMCDEKVNFMQGTHWATWGWSFLQYWESMRSSIWNWNVDIF